MISVLSGKLLSKGTDSVTLMTPGGVGYAIRLSSLHIGQLLVGQDVQLHTYLRVTDNDLSLFGFESLAQRAFFVLLLSVSGVGPKSAMNILNLGSIADIQSAIARSDVKYLTAVQGMGKKTAERMIVELRSKISKQQTGGSEQQPFGQVLSDVVDGLVAMGYSSQEAKDRVKGMDVKGRTAEELLREALRGK